VQRWMMTKRRLTKATTSGVATLSTGGTDDDNVCGKRERNLSLVDGSVGGHFAVIFERKQEPAAAAAPAAASAPEPGYMAELEKLAQLRDQGILSEEEFEVKKKQVLGI
jgi:hypothetical protein